MAACSGGDQGSSERRHIANNFPEVIVTALDDPLLQDLDRDVLERAKASGRIAQADYDESFSRFAQCMLTSGKPVKLSKVSNVLYQVENAPVPEGETTQSIMAIVTRCQQGTVGSIAGLYSIQQGNPELLANPYEVVHKCLQTKGMVDSDYSHEELRKAMSSPRGQEADLEDLLSFDPYGDEAQACFLGANMAFGR